MRIGKFDQAICPLRMITVNTSPLILILALAASAEGRFGEHLISLKKWDANPSSSAPDIFGVGINVLSHGNDGGTAFHKNGDYSSPSVSCC